MNRRYAFTIIELLISLSLSSVIMMGMIQGQRNVMRFVDRTRLTMLMNRKVCLLFNQIERDLNTAIIPRLQVEEKKPKGDGKEGDKKPKKSKEQLKKEEEDKKKSLQERNTKYFVSHFIEDATRMIDRQKYELFKDATWACTNPLLVYGQKKIRLVRVGYQLVKDKQKSKKEKISYKLYRQETNDLENVEFKQPEQGTAKAKTTVLSRYLVADDIKGFYIKFAMPEPKKKKGAEQKDDEDGPKAITAFDWGASKKTGGLLPQTAQITLVFWDEEMKRDYSFSCFVVMINYPTIYTAKERTPEPKKQGAPDQAAKGDGDAKGEGKPAEKEKSGDAKQGGSK